MLCTLDVFFNSGQYSPLDHLFRSNDDKKNLSENICFINLTAAHFMLLAIEIQNQNETLI